MDDRIIERKDKFTSFKDKNAAYNHEMVSLYQNKWESTK